jgi:cytochrome c551/c552
MIRAGWFRGFGTALLAFAAGNALAQSESQGRAVFRDAGCVSCHAYVAKIGAPSAKQMKGSFRGNPAGVQKGISNAPTHATDPTVKSASKEQVRLITEWLSGAWSAGAAVASIPPAKVVAAPLAVPAKPVEETPRQKKERLEAEARARREAETLARLERAEKARKDAEARATLKREADEKARLAAADRDRRAAEERAALKREADEKSKRAAEAKTKRDADLQAVQKKEADDLARRVAEAKAKNDVEAQTRLKREADEKARLAEAAKAKAEADERAAKQKAAEELAKREAELKARRDAEEQAALKREAEERARRETELAKREAEAKAKRDAEAKARRDAELAAAAAKPAPVVVATAKPDRSQLKAPEKFRDEPCPPGSGAPIIVDEARAKAIMDRIDCGGCHAYVQKKTGPPFKKVFEKVKGNPECVIERLKKNQEHNDEGVTDELKGIEFKIVADYVATRAK